MYFLKKLVKWRCYGYWGLDPFGTGEDFDVKAFIRDARAGILDDHNGYFDVRDRWFLDFEERVLAGVYDCTLFNRFRFMLYRMEYCLSERFGCSHFWSFTDDPDVMTGMFVCNYDLTPYRKSGIVVDLLVKRHRIHSDGR